MDESGLSELGNPSKIFLEERSDSVSGTSIYPSLEGTRPILLEVQALVTNASYNTPQRNVTGFDYKRLGMLIAVLEKRMGLSMGTKDIFVNLVGGLKIDDPAADLSIIAAIASSTMFVEMLKGKTLEEAKQIKDKEIAAALELPPIKLHCSVLAEETIQKAIKDWEDKTAHRRHNQYGTNEWSH